MPTFVRRGMASLVSDEDESAARAVSATKEMNGVKGCTSSLYTSCANIARVKKGRKRERGRASLQKRTSLAVQFLLPAIGPHQ